MLPTGEPRKDKRGAVAKGFSLLEVIISMGLITMVLLTVFRVQAQNIDIQGEAMFMHRASQLARERLTVMRTQNTLVPGKYSGNFGKYYSQYRYEVEVSPLPAVENLYRTTISITQKKGTRNYQTTTYLFRASP